MHSSPRIRQSESQTLVEEEEELMLEEEDVEVPETISPTEDKIATTSKEETAEIISALVRPAT